MKVCGGSPNYQVVELSVDRGRIGKYKLGIGTLSLIALGFVNVQGIRGEQGKTSAEKEIRELKELVVGLNATMAQRDDALKRTSS